MSGRPLTTGPLRWAWAVARARLPKVHKAVLGVGLAPHLGWATWECDPSIARIASNCGYSVRAVEDTLADLERRGIVTYLYRSRGGKPNTFKVDVEALEALDNPAAAAGSNPANDADELRTKQPATPQSTPSNPAPTAEEHIRQQTNQQTATTATSGEPGGGGGGGSEVRAGWAKRLIAAGVSRSEAPKLAALPHLTEDSVSFVLERARRKAGDPGAYIASMLRKRLDELRGFEPDKDQRQRQTAPRDSGASKAEVQRTPRPEVDSSVKARAAERRGRERETPPVTPDNPE